jgi:pimeloyl-ACP methyl ester carboxylesterase
MEQFVRIDGVRLLVDVRGEGRPVLLINGLGASLPMWDELHEDLNHVQVISYDAPGTGRSSTPRRPYTITALARAASQVLDELGHDQADVVGYSLGGIVAQALAAHAPERVHRLVLVGTACGLGSVPGPLSTVLSVATPIRYYSKTAYALTTPLIAGGGAERDPRFIERTAASRVHSPPSVPGYALQLAAAWTCSTLPWLHRIEHPTLLLAGAKDRLVPPVNSALLAANLPHARRLLYDDWGHYLLMDRQSGAGAAIADFLKAETPEHSATWRLAHSVSHDELEVELQEIRGAAQPAAWMNRIVRSLVTTNGR